MVIAVAPRRYSGRIFRMKLEKRNQPKFDEPKEPRLEIKSKDHCNVFTGNEELDDILSLPRPGERLAGFSRSTLVKLCKAGALRYWKVGNKRNCKLVFSAKSLLAYIKSNGEKKCA